MPGLERDRQPVDPLPLDRVDLEAQAVVRHLVARPGCASQLAEDEPGDSVVVLVRQIAVELLIEVVDRERAVDADRVVVDPLDRLVRQVELVFDLTDDLLEQVLECHDALHRAVLVDHDREVLVRAAELGQERREVLRLRNHVRRPDELLHLHRGDAVLVHRHDQIADVQHTDDVVE